MEETNKTAKKARHKYTVEFKAQAVAHVHRHGGDLTRTAAELGVNYWTLRYWLEAAQQKKGLPKSVPRPNWKPKIGGSKRSWCGSPEQRDILKNLWAFSRPRESALPAS